MKYVICKKWFENQSLGATFKNSPTIVETVILGRSACIVRP